MNAMQQIEQFDEDCARVVSAMVRDVDPNEVCWNCGDGRGWTMSMDFHGNPEQVQCPCGGNAGIADVYTRDDITRIMRRGRR